MDENKDGFALAGVSPYMRVPYRTRVWYAKLPGVRKLFNVQRIMIILKDLTIILIRII